MVVLFQRGSSFFVMSQRRSQVCHAYQSAVRNLLELSLHIEGAQVDWSSVKVSVFKRPQRDRITLRYGFLG